MSLTLNIVIPGYDIEGPIGEGAMASVYPVSYTHLTLPTIYSV